MHKGSESLASHLLAQQYSSWVLNAGLARIGAPKARCEICFEFIVNAVLKPPAADQCLLHRHRRRPGGEGPRISSGATPHSRGNSICARSISSNQRSIIDGQQSKLSSSRTMGTSTGPGQLCGRMPLPHSALGKGFSNTAHRWQARRHVPGPR